MAREDIIYPAIAFSRDGTIHCARKESDLIYTNTLGLKNGFFNELEIVDFQARLFKIKFAKKIKFRDGIYGWLMQRIIVELFGSKINDNINIEILKNKLFSYMNNDLDFWTSRDDYEDIISKVKLSHSHQEIVSFLTDIFYPGST